MKIYPAILTESLAQAQQQLEIAQGLQDVETVQIDIIDGKFADNLTITPADFGELDFGDLTCDLHLMTEEPMDGVYELIEYSRIVPVRAVIGQVERMSKQAFFLEEIEKHEWEPGVSLDIFTPLEAIDDASWQYLKVVQLMGVEAGAQGKTFNPLVLQKIDELKTLALKFEKSIEIIVDGGINPETIVTVADEGVDAVVVGSALWNARDNQALLKQLQSV
jgi:ribulose-phosphate 3-epimerase